MFVLVHLKDIVRIQPSNLTDCNTDLMGTIRNELNIMYTNKVIPDQGLVVAIHSILSHNAPSLYAGDGGAYIRVAFRVVVFKPFESEILIGRISQSTDAGIFVSTEFFHHIFVPKENLLAPCSFDADQKVWIWESNGNEYYFDKHAVVRLRVAEIKFAPFNTKLLTSTGEDIFSAAGRAQQHGYQLTDEPPKAPSTSPRSSVLPPSKSPSPTAATPAAPKADVLEGQDKAYVAPLVVVGSMNENGLGDIVWW